MRKITAEQCREQFEQWFRDVEAGDDDNWSSPKYLSREWHDYLARRQLALGAWNKALEIALPILEQQERVIEQVKCPFPCGWKELLRVAMNDGAFLSQKLIEGEEVRDIHRHAALSNTDRLVRMITAILDASEAVEQQERGNKATLTDEKREWLIDECKADMQRYTSNSPRYLVAQIALASLEACCIIPEQPTNQKGEQ